MKYLQCVAALTLAAGFLAAPVHAKTICTAVADAKTGKILLQQGNCSERYTPASTFKVALSVMGFDAGFLQDAHTPTLPFHEGYVDWGGDNWRQPTDPTRWLKYSVVWFSQQITQSLGQQRLQKYANSLGYGNADFSGDPGKDNGLERAWIGSSLKISPLEQVAFLQKLVSHELPVTPRAMEMTLSIVEKTSLPSGWEVQGKTGMAYPRLADGALDEVRPYGWFVGWASKGGRKLVFARLIQDDKKEAGTAGVRSRDAFFKELPALAESLAP
ncbi:class D beta-lactamase [Collimonas pratensis]|uniref:beta-lactamase n=1 Tax=Collimonas pratensis TaxID=279113 RepID=A0ABN4M8K0_9BURK|nr:class D beta-lactamase [Collimonas pratensis]AMP13463.1 penicillin binding transpeptidase domain protein [Collimonas pratensis]